LDNYRKSLRVVPRNQLRANCLLRGCDFTAFRARAYNAKAMMSMMMLERGSRRDKQAAAIDC